MRGFGGVGKKGLICLPLTFPKHFHQPSVNLPPPPPLHEKPFPLGSLTPNNNEVCEREKGECHGEYIKRHSELQITNCNLIRKRVRMSHLIPMREQPRVPRAQFIIRVDDNLVTFCRRYHYLIRFHWDLGTLHKPAGSIRENHFTPLEGSSSIRPVHSTAKISV